MHIRGALCNPRTWVRRLSAGASGRGCSFKRTACTLTSINVLPPGASGRARGPAACLIKCISLWLWTYGGVTCRTAQKPGPQRQQKYSTQRRSTCNRDFPGSGVSPCKCVSICAAAPHGPHLGWADTSKKAHPPPALS